MNLGKFARGLLESPLYRYSDWPNSTVPNDSGAYAVWQEDELVWVGSAGGSLRSRFDRHIKGQRRGSEFLKSVYSRLMFRHMGLEKAMKTAGETQLLVDLVTTKFVRKHLAYRYLTTKDEQTAEQIAHFICSGKASAEKPFLNPAD